MEVTFSLTGGAIATLLAFGLRAYRQGKIRRYKHDVELPSIRAVLEPKEEPKENEEEEVGLNTQYRRDMEDLVRQMLKDHCPVEQEKMVKDLANVIRAAVSDQTRDLVQWRGQVEARLEHSNGSDRDLHNRMDRLEDGLRKDISALRELLIKAIQQNRNSGGSNGP